MRLFLDTEMPSSADTQLPPPNENLEPVYNESTQASLFGEFPYANLGRLNQDEEIRKALVADLHDHAKRHPGQSRAHVAEVIQDLVGEPFSEDILNAYTALSRRNYQFPARKIAAWCIALNSTRLVGTILKPLSRRMATSEEERLSRLGALDSQIARLEKERSEILGRGESVLYAKR
jgi:hypothetical protein